MAYPKGFYVDPKEVTVGKGKHYVVECGCCGGFHPARYTGDCRSDENRYGSIADYAERNAVRPEIVVEVFVDEDTE